MTQQSFIPSLFGNGRSPRDMVSTLQSEIDRVFDSFAHGRMPSFGGEAEFSPPVNVAETAEAVEVTVELPGCEPKDIDAHFVGRTLVVHGEKKSEHEEKGKNWHRIERSHGEFTRQIPLGFDPPEGKVDARFDKGVLAIHIPKPAEARAEKRAIEIKAS